MKIANNSLLSARQIATALLIMLPACFSFSHPILAQTPPSPAALQVAPPPQAAAAPASASADSVTAETAKPNEDLTKTLTTMEDKVTENAKGVVKRLDETSDPTTIADLNNARQTITRIEAMIDIEKHLAELDKVRNERTNAHTSVLASSLASVIPASALNPVPKGAAFENPTPTPSPEAMMRMMGGGRMEVTRIYGSQGVYKAVLKLPTGDDRTVQVGDQVGGSTVRSITPAAVMLEGKEGPSTLHVKNADTVYSAMR